MQVSFCGRSEIGKKFLKFWMRKWVPFLLCYGYSEFVSENGFFFVLCWKQGMDIHNFDCKMGMFPSMILNRE